MRTVIIGAKGQLGQELLRILDGDVIPLTREQADLTDAAAVHAVLERAQPDVVVNCAAYNFVDRAETELNAAFAVNTWAVRDLARSVSDLGFTLVHISTDYVFGLDQSRSSPWTEDDLPGPVSVYGLSKLAGEYVARAYCSRHLIVRTCGLYGLHGQGGKKTNFLETMLRLAGEGKPLRVVADQYCTPSYAPDVAAGIAALMAHGARGLFHVTNSGACSWYELAKELFEQAGVVANLTPIPTSEYPTPARRPGYSVLSTAKAESVGMKRLRPWRDAVAAYLAERKAARG